MRRFSAMILDIDGTFIDSNKAHAEAWCEVLNAHGFPAEVPAVQRLVGMGGDKLLPKVTGLSAESSEGRKISKERSELFMKEYLPKLSPFPKSRELVETLIDSDIKLCVGTSAKKDELEPLLEVARLKDLLPQRTSSDDAESSKPDPDIIHASLKKLGFPPEQVLMLGDTPYDIEAAKKAGVATLAVRSGGWSDAELHGALAIYDDVADLLRQFGTSPLI